MLLWETQYTFTAVVAVQRVKRVKTAVTNIAVVPLLVQPGFCVTYICTH